MLHNKNSKKEEILLKAIVFICVAILAVTSVSAYIPHSNEQRIYEDLIRLHVLANSNSQEDQDLKYEIRDEMIEYISSITQNCENTQAAKTEIEQNLAAINEKVQESIKKRGYSYTSQVTLTREPYPTTDYDTNFSLPKGTYNSLRILIGNAEGKNWWCVLFPPLCLSGSKVETELAVAGYTNEQIQILKKDSPKYVIRFKVLELLSEWFN